MVRAMLRGTDMRDAKFEPWILPYRVFAYANVTLRRGLDLLPGARRRAADRKEDMHWRALTRIGRLTARREGVREASYDHHNATASIKPGAPIPSIGRCPMGH